MHRPFTMMCAAAFIASALTATRVTAADLTAWFQHATAFQETATSRAMAAPDYLPGNSLRSMACSGGAVNGQIRNGIWLLVKYDRTHHIGLAAATTDQCSVALFQAPAPTTTVPDADLSHYRTGRGLQLGSTYAQVLAGYGGHAVPHGHRFVTSYSAQIPHLTESLPKKTVQLGEMVTLVLENDRVSSITMSVDLGSLY